MQQPNMVKSGKHPQETQQNTGVYVKYPISIDPEAGAVTTHDDQPHPQQDVQPKTSIKKTQGWKTQQQQLHEQLLQQQQQIKAMQQQNEWLQQRQWQHQIAELQKSNKKEKREDTPHKTTRIVNGILRPKIEEISIQGDTQQLVTEVDRPVSVNHYYAALAAKQSNYNIKGNCYTL